MRSPDGTDDALPPEGILTRELLLKGNLGEMIRAVIPDAHILSDAERAASLRAMLDARPERGGGVWVFAYGSLIWNPAIHIAERRTATIRGWHRAFCMSIKAGRGTPEKPGLMLALMEGGDCEGVALRVAEDAVETELELLWRREMVAEGYIPRWVELLDPAGTAFGHAIAFTVNPDGPSYCGKLAREETVRRLATARGGLGTGAEYLFRTRDGLRAIGITDPWVESLAADVAALMAAQAAPAT